MTFLTRVLLAMVVLSAILAFAPFRVFAQVTVSVVATDPASPATLGKWEQFYLRIGYNSDRVIRVRAYPMFQGKEVPGMTSGSYLYQAGSGEAFYWFAFTDARHVDSVTVAAEDAATGKRIAETMMPVELTWTEQPPAESRVRADWVGHMLEEQNRRAKEEYQAYMGRPGRIGEDLIGMAVVWCLPAYLVLQLVLLIRYQGGWKWAAAVPLLLMIPLFIHALYAYSKESNLWPLLLIFGGPPALIYLIVLIFVRKARTA